MSLSPTVHKGDVFRTNNCGSVTVLKYELANRIKIKFKNTGYICYTTSYYLRHGTIKDPLHPSVFNLGFLGVGIYGSKSHVKQYYLWHSMMTRCYSPIYLRRFPTYIGCTVSKRWHNFQNFAADIEKMPNWNTPGFDLDKDLRVLGNKVYGCKYCSFVPKRINYFSTSFSSVGMYGKGVVKYGKYGNKFSTHFYKRIFNSPRKAASYFLKEKRRKARRLAKFYRLDIHMDVYQTLMDWREDV